MKDNKKEKWYKKHKKELIIGGIGVTALAGAALYLKSKTPSEVTEVIPTSGRYLFDADHGEDMCWAGHWLDIIDSVSSRDGKFEDFSQIVIYDGFGYDEMVAEIKEFLESVKDDLAIDPNHRFEFICGVAERK